MAGLYVRGVICGWRGWNSGGTMIHEQLETLRSVLWVKYCRGTAPVRESGVATNNLFAWWLGSQSRP